MPSWLWRSIVAVAGLIALLAVLQWASCTFYVLPRWPVLTQANRAGEAGAPGPLCEDAGTRSQAALMALLTTLISLSRQAKED
jgi:hypothetical protein